ncbi:MAG TPA: amidohydrolase family protein [Beijerinckiaceae bacterium]|nr:amidohydrolase family protein [Beijerinckiaceae bacterium]
MNVVTPVVRDPAHEEFDTRTLLAHAAQQADDRHYEDFMIIDVDAHHYETGSYKEIFDYIEDPVLRDQFKYSKGATMQPRSTGGYQEMAGRITRYQHRTTEKAPGAPHRDIGLTRKWMDAMGTDVACVFPTPMLGLGLNPVVEVEVSYANAYNRWLTEHILAVEPRMVSMLYLPMNDPDAALKTVEKFSGRKVVIGFLVTTVRYKPLYDNAYMKLYAALEERGLPLAFHAATNWGDQSMHITNRFISAHALGFTWFNIVHMTNWVVNAIPERFPGLKSIWIESGLAWIPFLMQRLDNEYMMRSSETPSLKRKPSDYMREMFYTSQPMEMVGNATMLQETFKMISAETQLLYSSDYPHWDMDLPSTIYDLPFLSAEGKRNILGGNARKLFKLDEFISDKKKARRAALGKA